MPAKREELLSLAQQPEDRLLISQLWDKMSQAEKYFQPACTPFLDLRQQNLCRTAMERMGNRGFFLYGGYPQAERRGAEPPGLPGFPDGAGHPAGDGGGHSGLPPKR